MSNTRNTTRNTMSNIQFAGFLGELQRVTHVTLHLEKKFFKNVVLRVLCVVIHLKNMVSLVLRVMLRVALPVSRVVTQG